MVGLGQLLGCRFESQPWLWCIKLPMPMCAIPLLPASEHQWKLGSKRAHHVMH